LASPINQISSLTDLIVKKYEGVLDDEAKALVGFLQSSAGRLQNLLSGLRTYMRIAGTPAVFRRSDGNALLAGAVAMLQHTIARNKVVITHDPLPRLWCDPSQITYALANLIENSIKFRGESKPEIHVGAVADKKTWVLFVRDNGMGIDPRYATRIFGALKRIHTDNYPGSGVGLAITKRVVERHGGQIWVESELGHGATFFVELPKMNERRTKPPGEDRAVA
jgi:light-regulated signal transduction histidine kinase (bacteriophytochrome)